MVRKLFVLFLLSNLFCSINTTEIPLKSYSSKSKQWVVLSSLLAGATTGAVCSLPFVIEYFSASQALSHDTKRNAICFTLIGALAGAAIGVLGGIYSTFEYKYNNLASTINGIIVSPFMNVTDKESFLKKISLAFFPHSYPLLVADAAVARTYASLKQNIDALLSYEENSLTTAERHDRTALLEKAEEYNSLLGDQILMIRQEPSFYTQQNNKLQHDMIMQQKIAHEENLKLKKENSWLRKQKYYRKYNI